MARIDEDIKVLMLKGEKGADIASIEKTSTQVLTDVYTVTLTDGKKHTFSVTNGAGIARIEKTGTSGIVDTYTVYLTNNTTQSFNVTNGSSISTINKTGTNGLVDTYTVTQTNGNKTTFNVTNGRGITNVKKTSSSGMIDTYTIYYSDGTTSTFNLTNADASNIVNSLNDLNKRVTANTTTLAAKASNDIITDAFQSGKAYTAGDLVIADNALYKCIANTNGTIDVSNTTYFKQTQLKNVISDFSNVELLAEFKKSDNSYDEIHSTKNLDDYSLLNFTWRGLPFNNYKSYAQVMCLTQVFKKRGVFMIEPDNNTHLKIVYVSGTSISASSSTGGNIEIYGIK